MKLLKGVGHFPHLEVPDVSLEVLKELMAVPIK